MGYIEISDRKSEEVERLLADFYAMTSKKS
jgi:hypothetical protein